MRHYESTDIYKSAYFLCMGGSLADIRVNDRIATFEIAGEDLERQDMDYHTGRALVNPVQLRETLNLLRDMLFAKLRQGRDENDRTERHRRHQKGHRPRGSYSIAGH
jgi:hypothetical protein